MNVGTNQIVVALVLLSTPLGLNAQTGARQASPDTVQEGPDNNEYNHDEAPRARAVRSQTQIDVDGRLDEPIWADAPPITEFIQEDPAEGEPGTERTDFRIVYDDDAIYIGATLYDSYPITTYLNRRDVGSGDFDFIMVNLDSYHDHETAYQFAVNPSGAIRDAVSSSGGGGRGGIGGDTSWDPVWDVATQVTESGWSAEMRIPFSQLRFSRAQEQVWGIEIKRNIHRNQERVAYPFTPTLERGGASRFAHLDGIEGIEPGRKLELLPYVAARGEYLQPDIAPGVNFSNPYRSGSDYFREAGLDLKYRLASNVTLDATVNPDFGQVEVDPSVINLTAFETRYEERRPFFVEGGDLFQVGEGSTGSSTGRAPQLFYSRRIGRPPSGSVPSDGVFSDEASATTILGAAKVTGRVGGGWSLGILEAITAQETAAYTNANQTAGDAVVEPATNHLMGRVRRQVRGGETRFGLYGSAVNRRLAGTGMDNRLHSAAYSGGADFGHEWSNRTYVITSTLSGSHVQGDPAAISRTQRSSTRYYQRPDVGHLNLDGTANSLSGYYAVLTAAKQAGAVTGRVAMSATSPGYEVNDLGFQSYSDRIIIDTNFAYSQPDPGRILRQWSFRWSPDAVWNYAGDRLFTEVNGNIDGQLLNYWGGGVRLGYNPVSLDDRLTRGGPMASSPERLYGIVTLNSDGRRAIVGNLNYQWGVESDDSWDRRLSFNLTANPSERLRTQFGPSVTKRYVSAQYVSSVADPLASHTYGRRYVFGGLDQTTVSLQTRLNVTFTPDLSLQLYVEPFISTGDYRELKEFERPGTFNFLQYGTDVGTVSQDSNGGYSIDPDGSGPASAFELSDRDFSYRSLIGNAVLRWEWRPGSTLFLVWQQSRINSLYGDGINGIDPWIGSFDVGRDMSDMFATPANNIFAIKMSYWLNP
tara:strand:+ start:307 stop:3081 length:2775 start_codon:yes stop_codon:yes gene_type:complete